MIKKTLLAIVFLLSMLPGSSQLANAGSAANKITNVLNFVSCELSCSKETCGGSKGAWTNCFRKCKDDPNTIFNCMNAADKNGFVTACQKSLLEKSKPLSALTCQTKCTASSCKSIETAQSCFNGCFSAKLASIDNCVKSAIDADLLDDCQKEYWSNNSSTAVSAVSKIFKFVSCEVSCSKESCGGSEGAWTNCFKKCKDDPNTIFNCMNAADKNGFVTSCQKSILEKSKPLSAFTCQTKCTRQSCKQKEMAQTCYNGCFNAKWASIDNCVKSAIDEGHLDSCQQSAWEMKKK